MPPQRYVVLFTKRPRTRNNTPTKQMEVTDSLSNMSKIVETLLEQVVNQWNNEVLPQGINIARTTIKLAQDAYNEQLQQTPLTMKACAVLVSFIILIALVVSLKKPKHIHISKDNTTVLSVFDMAKTAYEPGHVETLIDLVKKRNFDINYPLPNSGLNLFLCACLSGQRKLIKFLLSKGANTKTCTHDGDSPLYLATFGVVSVQTSDQDRVDVLTDLISAGSDVNKQNNNGYTALHRAASRGNVAIIRCLLKHGASPYLTTNTGIYPIDLATNAGHLEAAELLTIQLDNPYVWDVVEPHTPSRVRLGLMSPHRKHLLESTAPRSHTISASLLKRNLKAQCTN